MPPSRRILLNLARALVSAGLLAWVISRSGLDALFAAARTASPPPLLAAYALAIAGMFLRTWRWLILLRAVGAKVSARRALYLYFAGGFFNVVLPTGFGGDVLRVLEIGPGASSEQAAGTVLVDRLTGFVALFLLALAALPFAGGLLPRKTALAIGLLAGGVCLGSALLFEGRLLRALLSAVSRLIAKHPCGTSHREASLWDAPRSPLPVPRLQALANWLDRTYGVITACGWRAILGALGASLAYNLSVIAAGWLIGRALGLALSPWLFALFLPLAVVALLVPISISGLGVREGIFVALLGQVGLSPAPATVLSLGLYSLDLFTGLIGGLLYLLAGLLGLRPR